MKNLITQLQALMIDALVNGNYEILAMPYADQLTIDIEGQIFETYRSEELPVMCFLQNSNFIPELTPEQKTKAYHTSTEKYKAYWKAHRKLQIEEQQIALANELKTL